ncbi:MAG: hypothetical protein HKN75_02910 [Bacteroidia bacterium]|nr:hypothetical protein [Bacteroidia bacterium]
MKSFLKKLVGFLFFAFVISCVLIASIIAYYGTQNLPALNFTDSYSFNEKVLFLKKQNLNPQVISIGSSMTLNNLHSETVLTELQTNSFANTASWGMNLQEDYRLLKLFDELYDLKKVIIVSNVIDYTQISKRIDFDFIRHYLLHDPTYTALSLVKNLDLKYYGKNIKYAQYVRNSTNEYEYLGYDPYGMVQLKGENFNINEKRWSHYNLRGNNIREQEYVYLDSISIYCQQNSLELYYFQSPYRDGLKSKFSANEMNVLNAHINRIQSTLKDNQYFVNSTKSSWNDSLFVDAMHFNEQGAKQFTKFCFDEAIQLKTK